MESDQQEIGNLWPEDLVVKTERSPVFVLRVQATHLGQNARNIILGEVVPYDHPITLGEVFTKTKKALEFRFNFNIIAPALGNYSFQLFQLWNGIDLYPAKLQIDHKSSILNLKNEHELCSCLRDIFHAPRTRKIVTAMLSLSEFPHVKES